MDYKSFIYIILTKNFDFKFIIKFLKSGISIKFFTECGFNINEMQEGKTLLYFMYTGIDFIGQDKLSYFEDLLKNGADPNTKFPCPLLFKAIVYNMSDMVKILLEYGADPNIRDQQGNTPLHTYFNTMSRFTFKGVRSLKLLLKAGANVNAVNDRGEKTYISSDKILYDEQEKSIINSFGNIKIKLR